MGLKVTSTPGIVALDIEVGFDRLLHVWPRRNVEMRVSVLAQRLECKGGHNGAAGDLHGRVARPREIE